eukprot:768475-Hanusia_phi.AAC.9
MVGEKQVTDMAMEEEEEEDMDTLDNELDEKDMEEEKGNKGTKQEDEESWFFSLFGFEELEEYDNVKVRDSAEGGERRGGEEGGSDERARM